MRLLQSTWAELLTLTTAFRSLEQFSSQATGTSGNINSISEENNDNGLKLRYATDYWLDKRLAKQCCLVNVDSLSSINGDCCGNLIGSGDGTRSAMSPTVMDIYNLVSIIFCHFLQHHFIIVTIKY